MSAKKNTQEPVDSKAEQWAELQLARMARRKKFWAHFWITIRSLLLLAVILFVIVGGFFILIESIESITDFFVGVHSDHLRIERIEKRQEAFGELELARGLEIQNGTNDLANDLSKAVWGTWVDGYRTEIDNLSNRLAALEPKPMNTVPYWNWSTNYCITNQWIAITNGLVVTNLNQYQ